MELPLILTHKLLISSSFIPGQSSMQSAVHWHGGLCPLLCLPFLLSSQRSHRVCDASKITALQACPHLWLSFLDSHATFTCIEAFEGPPEGNLVAGNTGIPLCCSSDALLLTCYHSPCSGYLLLTLPSNWYEWHGLRFSSPNDCILPTFPLPSS